jgi:Carboxypeptidase regulatory-like domain
MERNIGRIMGLRCTLPIAVVTAILATFCPAQERFETGWLKGFTESPTEHIIDELDKPFTLRAVRGVVLDASGAEMDGVVVEIRDEAGRIRGTKTNRNGTFKLSGVPKGTYKFKVTMNGFQSVVGNLIISKMANKTDQMKIAMKVGV